MRYFKLSDGRTVTCRDAQAVSTLINWGRENKIGLSEVYWYKTPDGKDWTVDAWAKNNGALDNPKLKGAMDMGAKEAHDHPFVRGDQATIQARKPGEAGLAPSHEKTFIEKAWDVVKHPLKAGIRTALGPVGSVVDLYAGAAKLVSGNDKNKANPIYQDPEPPRWVQEPLNRRNEAVTKLENLSVSRPPAEAPELESAWKQQYDSTLAEAEKQEEIYLFRATGLTEAQREYKDETATWAKKYPLLATLSQLPTGFEALYKAPANVMAAGGAIDTKKGWWYAKRQGLAEGLAEAGKGWSDWGSALYSFGLTMPSYVATLSIALSGGATAPVAGPLIIAAASARELSSMSDNLRDSYFNDGVLSTNELWAGATNAFIEEGIETIGLNLQAGTFANAYKLGGTAGMQKAIATQLGKKAMPGLAQGGLTFMTMYGEELGEEILTNVGQMVVNNVMLGTPLPTREELQQQFRDTAVQTLYGTILQGGVSVGYTVVQSQSQMRKLTALSDETLSWSSPKLALDAINQLKAFDIEGAKATAMKAQETLIKDDAAMADKAKKVVAQAIGNVLDASLKYDMQTAEGVYVEQKAVQKTLDRLEAEQKQLEQDKPSPERDQRLFDIGEQIEELQQESIRIDSLITENAQQKEIYNILNEASKTEQKARKAGNKAVDKLVKTKEYKEATPEQQRQMIKDAVLSDKKSAKLQEKADQKYREANLYKLRQTNAYKQAAPEVQAQMEEAELQRQQEAIAAEFEAARQKAISEQQEAEKAAETASNEATEDNEVVPDIIDQLEAKKAALRQERQDINKELNEYRKLMDQQGGWLPSVTPEQKKAYHEVKKRQKEVNRRLNEVGIEIRKEKANRKKAEREAQKPKKKVDKKDTKKDTATSEDKDGQKDKERTPGNQRQDTKSDEQQRDDRGESAGTGQADRQGGQDEGGEAGAEEKPKQRKTYVKTKSGGKTRVFEATRIEGEWIYYTNERGTESRTKRNPRTQTTNDPLVYRKWKSEHANRSRGAQRAAQKRDRRLTMSQKVLDSMPNLAALQGRVFPPGEAGDLKNVFIPGYGPLCRESKNDQEWTYDTIYENSIPTPEGAQASRDADYKPILEAAEKELDRWYDGRQTQDTDYWDEAQKAQEEIEYYEKELDKATTEEERQLIRQKLTELDGRVFDDYTEAEQDELEKAESDGVELNDQGYPASWDTETEAATGEAEPKKEAPQKEKEPEPEPEKTPKKEAEPKNQTVKVYRTSDGTKRVTSKNDGGSVAGSLERLPNGKYKFVPDENMRRNNPTALMTLLDDAYEGIINASATADSALEFTKDAIYEQQGDDFVLVEKGKMGFGISQPDTDTRTKSEALQETLPTIPDKTADDALLGMVKSHILSITRKDRTTTVNFKDGRQLVINHITQEAMLTEAGKTGVKYAGRTKAEKGKKNVYTAIVDLVDGLNQGNRTLFHESFHVVWKLFLSNEQISYIKQYYRVKANKGELVRKYVVTRQGTEMALYWTKEQFNALNKERQAEALEEGAAYGFEHWLGSRTDTAPTTMIGKLWQRLADAIRHALVKLNLANQNAKLTDIFHAVASDKLTGQGEQGAETRNMVANAYHGSAADFEKFDSKYVGTGEGAAAFGWGTAYITQDEGTGRWYADAIAGYKSPTMVRYGGKEYERTEFLDYLKSRSDFKNADTSDHENGIFKINLALMQARNNPEAVRPLQDSIEFQKRVIENALKSPNDRAKYAKMNEAILDNLNLALKLVNNSEIARASKEGRRHLYEVVAWPDKQEDVLEWDKRPTQEQIEKIAAQFALEGRDGTMSFLSEMKTGQELYETIGHRLRLAKNDKATSEFLLRAGIDGIKYPVNALSGGKGEKGYNYVVFDADQIQIKDHTRYKPAPTAAEVAEAERQYAEVEAKYKGTDQWLKAPNGKASNLNERQWVQVRTPNFKQFFGNWEISALTSHYKKQIAELRSLFSPSILLRVVQSVPNKSIINSLQTYSKQFSDFLESKSLAPESIGKINIDSAVINKMLGLTAIDNEILDAVIRLIPVDVVNNFARQKFSIEELLHDKAMLKNILTISEDSAVTPLVDKASAVSLIDAIATKTAELSRLIEVMFKLGSALEAPADALFYVFHKEDINSDRANLSSTILRRFGDWLNDPKNASKVVDENGEPLVVWHGSMEYGFNEFHNGRRHYFTDNGIVAEEYSGYYEDKIYDVFLNLRNPVIADAGGMRYTDITFGKAEREADENGHDGAIISNVDDAKYLLKGSTAKIGTTYIATSKTQIKSATANVGTFSENPDIRYKTLNIESPQNTLPKDLPLPADWWNEHIVKRANERMFLVEKEAESYGTQSYVYELRSPDSDRARAKTTYRDYDEEKINPIKTRYDKNIIGFDGEIIDDRYQWLQGNKHLNSQEPNKTAMWRGISAPEMASIINTGKVESLGDMNFDSQQGRTSASQSPSQAVSYASSFAAWYDKPTFDAPAYVLEMSRPDNAEINMVNEIEIVGATPVTAIEKIYEIRVAEEIPGKTRINHEKYGRERLFVSLQSPPLQKYVVRELSKSEWKDINPDIRYRKLTERERAMRDDVWNEIMGRTPTPRAQARPKVQTEPPEKEQKIVPESTKAEADLNQYTGKTKAAKRDRSTDILTRADDIELSDRIKQIAAELGVDDKNSDKKFDIIVNAARRMADQNWLTLADNESLRHIVEKIIDTNKPGNTDKTDMVLHDDEAMILMQNIGVNREQLHKAGEDGYTLFLQNLAEFAYGNYLIDQKNRLLDEMNEPHTPAEVEQIANAIRIQDGLIEQSRVVNKNVASVAGRILHGQQIMNRARIQEASKQISVLTQRNRQILARVAELRERIAVAQANFNKFKERYEQLRAALNERKPTAERYKTIDEMSDNELLSQLDAAFAEMTNYEMEMESLAGQLDSDIQRIKLNNEMSQKLNTELDTAKKRRNGGKVRITDLPARKADVFDFIDAIAYANALSSLTTHGVNIIATASNSFIETGLNWIASPAASKLSTKIKVDHKKRLNDAVNALRDEVWFWNDNARQRSKDRGKSKYGHAQQEVEAGDRHGKRVDRMLWWAYEITNMNTKTMSGEDQLFYTLKYSEQIQSLAAYEARLRTKSKAEQQRIAQQLYDHPTPDMIKQASIEAQETCFNQNPTGWFGDLVGVINKIYSSLKSRPIKISREVNGKDVTTYDPVAIASRIVAFPLTWTIMPFTRVVANVGNTWIKWTPFGVKNLIDLMDTNPDSHINQQRNIWVDANGRRRVSPYRQRDINRQKARVLVGTLLMSTLMAWAMGVFDDDDDEELAKLKATTKYKQATPSQRAAMDAELVTIRRMGRISGPGPKDYQLLKQLRDTYGYSPWSVKGKDGIWVPYTDHPMAGVLSSVGVVYDYFTWNKPKRPKDFWQYVGISMLGIARAFQDKQFLNNLSDTNEAIMRGDDRWLGRQISGTATRWIPLNANFLRLMDKMFVDDKSYAPETLGQQMLATSPFIPSEKNLPTKTNVAGLPERQASWHNRFVSLPRSDEYMTWTDSNGNGHNMKEIIRTIGGKGAKLPTIRSYEFKLPDGRYIWLYGKDKKEYEILRTSLLNAGVITNEAEIRELATQTDSKPLKTKLATLARKATIDAKEQILEEWDENTLSLKENYSTRIYGDTKTEEEE